MSTWITSMAHFPGPRELSKRMPMPLIETTLQFGSIVQTVTTKGPNADHSCGGKIEASLVGADKIAWKCEKCGDDGEISHFRGSGWDDLPEKHMPKLVVVSKKPEVPKKARAPKKSRQGTLLLAKRELSALRKVAGDSDLAEILVHARPIGNEFALDLTIKELDGLYSLVGDLLDFGPRHQRKMWDAWTAGARLESKSLKI